MEIMDYSNLFVCLMGMGTVFIGLICIVVLVSLMGIVCRKTDHPKAAAPAAAAPAPAVAAPTVTPAMVAAVAAVIAEDMGTSVDAIRIVSMKKL